jgi:hypothetical protein
MAMRITSLRPVKQRVRGCMMAALASFQLRASELIVDRKMHTRGAAPVAGEGYHILGGPPAYDAAVDGGGA